MLMCVRHSRDGLHLRRDHARSIPPTVGNTLGANQNPGQIKRRKTD
jgi:hypothetical protein